MTQSLVGTLSKASKQYGLPLWYVYVTETIYEGLPHSEFPSFPYQAIKRCMDLFKVPFNLIDKAEAEASWVEAEAATESALGSAWTAACAALGSVWAADAACEAAWAAALASAVRTVWAEGVAKAEYFSWMKDMLFSCIEADTNNKGS